MSPKKVKNRQNFQLKKSEAISGVLLIIAISGLAGFFMSHWVGPGQSVNGYSLEDDERAILIGPTTDNQTLKIKAASLWAQKDVLGSRIIYEQMLEKDMHDYDANLYLGTILKDYSKPPDLERAALCYDRALEAKRTMPALRARADMYVLEGENELATKLFKEAFLIDPTDEGLLWNYALLEMKKMNYAEALGLFDSLIQLKPDHVLAKKYATECSLKLEAETKLSDDKMAQ